MARKSRKLKEEPEINLTPDKKTAIYIRLSREDVGKKGDSLENQKHIALEYLLTIPELGTPVIYEDNGYTGRNTQRPQFQKMIEDIEAGLIEAVIVKDLSRISRNSIDSGYYIEKVFPLHGIRFISVTDSYDSALDLDGTEGAIIPIKNMLNEAHSLDLSKKIKSVKRKSMRDGEYISSLPPFGYRKSRTNHYQLEIDELSSKVVLELFERTLNGERIGSIVRILNDRRELTPVDYYSVSKGKSINLDTAHLWGNHAIEKILTSEVYIGNLIQGKHETVDGVYMKKDESKWVKTENTHEPLVSLEDFEKVQEIVKQNKKAMERKTHKPNPYVKKLFCGHCGRPMSRCTLHRQEGTIFKYKCKSNYLVRKDYCSAGFDNVIWESELDDAIGAAINLSCLLAKGNRLETVVDEIRLSDKEELLKSELKTLEKSIKKQQISLKSLYENLVKGIITQNDYVELKANYETGIMQQKSRCNLIVQDIEKIQNEILVYAEFSTLNEENPLQITESIINSLITRVIVSVPEEPDPVTKHEVEIVFAFDDFLTRDGDTGE